MIKKYVPKVENALVHLNGIKIESNRGYLWILIHFYILHRKFQISFNEYFYFEFEKQTRNFKETFLSAKNKKKYLELLNPRKYYILARNKYLTHLLLENAGIAKSTLYCYYDPAGRYEPGKSGFDYHSVLKIIKAKNIESFIIKPTENSHGEGVMLIKSIDYINDGCYLNCFNGKAYELSEILRNEPLILESVIEQTGQFKKFNSTSVNTVRFMTILLPTGNAKIIAAFLKVGRNGACIDNAGSGGNVDAAINIDTGEIHSVVQFNGWRDFFHITHHPDTGELMEGVIIENWLEIKNEVLKYQQALPFLKAIGWDIAITDNGPVVIEINDLWDETGQLFIQRGWRNEIEDCYNDWSKYMLQ